MSTSKTSIHAVPTNIITGFLGVGKTSAILNLLQHKPADERWAVLVNEFGEVGVDGSLFQGQLTEDVGIFVREVPSGCMCCAAGLPMQIALNQLLQRAKPDRLLIEPTGLGHPQEVMQVLSSSHYRDVISLQKTLTLIDARQLSSPKHRGVEVFDQQIDIADILVANKLDLYREEDKATLMAYAQARGISSSDVVFTQHGEIELSLLEGPASGVPAHHHQHHHGQTEPLTQDLPMPECGFIKAQNSGEGFSSVGWRISPEKVFSRQKVFSFVAGLQVERTKAVFITDEGIFGYNLTADTLTEIELDECVESRIEIISDGSVDGFEDELFACVSHIA